MPLPSESSSNVSQFPRRIDAGTSASATVHVSSAFGGGGGGNMDDVLNRLRTVEGTVSDIRANVSALSATASHLATKADVSDAVGSLTWRFILAGIASVLGLAGLMARGFGWI